MRIARDVFESAWGLFQILDERFHVPDIGGDGDADDLVRIRIGGSVGFIANIGAGEISFSRLRRWLTCEWVAGEPEL